MTESMIEQEARTTAAWSELVVGSSTGPVGPGATISSPQVPATIAGGGVGVVIGPVTASSTQGGNVVAAAVVSGTLGVAVQDAFLTLETSIDNGVSYQVRQTVDIGGDSAGLASITHFNRSMAFVVTGLPVLPLVPTLWRVRATALGGGGTAIVTLANQGGIMLEEVSAAAGPPIAPVLLGAAAGFAGVGKAGISTVPPSVITGNIGVSPVSHTAITGFSLVLDGSGQFATSAQVSGKVFAADYAPPTPANMTASVLAMQAAYTDAASRVPNVTGLAGGHLGGLNLSPGVYRWNSNVDISTNLTLTGGAADVFIFQINGTLDLATATSVLLAGGVLAKNIFWQVTGAVTCHPTSSMEGVILAQTSIAMQTGSSITGALLAQTAVTLDTTTVVDP